MHIFCKIEYFNIKPIIQRVISIQRVTRSIHDISSERRDLKSVSSDYIAKDSEESGVFINPANRISLLS